jgi:hypothetical protein
MIGLQAKGSRGESFAATSTEQWSPSIVANRQQELKLAFGISEQ